MEITLNVKSDQVADSLNEIMTHLTTEQKEGLAKQMLDKWLVEPCALDPVMRETAVLREMRTKNLCIGGSWSSNRKLCSDMTDDEIKKTSEYRDLLNQYKSPKEKMIEEIVKTVISYHQREVTKVIQEDPRLEEVKTATIEYLKENYGKLIQQAMMYWLAEHMGQVASSLQDVCCKLPPIEENLQAINERLLRQ